jgi:hypothetical protein
MSHNNTGCLGREWTLITGSVAPYAPKDSNLSRFIITPLLWVSSPKYIRQYLPIYSFYSNFHIL